MYGKCVAVTANQKIGSKSVASQALVFDSGLFASIVSEGKRSTGTENERGERDECSLTLFQLIVKKEESRDQETCVCVGPGRKRMECQSGSSGGGGE